MKRYLYNAVIAVVISLSYPAVAQEFFDAGGYYFPEKDIVKEGYKLDSFQLVTISYYNDRKLDYEHPKIVGPEAWLYLVRAKDNKKFTYRFLSPTIEKNSVQLTSVTTPIGVLSINGKFLDTRGMFWNLSDVVSMETPVFEGAVSLMRDGKQFYKKISRFTYWEGD
jgi:hypothetical protein